MTKEKMPPYERVKDKIKDGELPSAPLSIQLKSGQKIADITPYAIVVRPKLSRDKNDKTLKLFYLDQDKKAHNVDIDEIQGLSVVKGHGDLEGKLMIKFTYFKGTHEADFREDKPRVVLPTDIYFGIHPFHASIGERKADAYIRGDDTQYAKNRSRQFPFWRIIGAYGSSNNLVDTFKK